MPPRERLLIQLKDVKRNLEALHKILLDATRRDYEKLHGPVKNPNAYLELALRDPLFGWLRPMSQLLVDITDLLEEEPVEVDIFDIRVRAKAVLSTGKYLELLQTDPEVGMSHGPVRWALQQLGT